MIGKTLATLVALIGIAAAIVYIAERGSTLAKVAANDNVWFVALRHGDGREFPPEPAAGNAVVWRANTDTVFVGEVEPYWDAFYLIGGSNDTPPHIPDAARDAYLVRLDVMPPPLMISGTLAMGYKTGLRRMSDGEIAVDLNTTAFGEGLGPTHKNIAALRARPAEQQPAMVNFLAYRDRAEYLQPYEGESGTGAEAYLRYGSVAFATVYSLGGRLIVSGNIAEVIREPDAGPTSGDWDQIAIMRYPNQKAILHLERSDEYRAALTHRTAGLARTRITVALESDH